MAMTRSPMALSFGMKKDNAVLASKLNRALKIIDEDWTLVELQGIYIYRLITLTRAGTLLGSTQLFLRK